MYSTCLPEGCCDWADNLADHPIQVLIGWPLNAEVSPADVIDGLIVNHEGTVGMFQGGVGSQDGVVGLHDCRADLRMKEGCF